jgi:hypothetical protein
VGTYTTTQMHMYCELRSLEKMAGFDCSRAKRMNMTIAFLNVSNVVIGPRKRSLSLPHYEMPPSCRNTGFSDSLRVTNTPTSITPH